MVGENDDFGREDGDSGLGGYVEVTESDIVAVFAPDDTVEIDVIESGMLQQVLYGRNYRILVELLPEISAEVSSLTELNGEMEALSEDLFANTMKNAESLMLRLNNHQQYHNLDHAKDCLNLADWFLNKLREQFNFISVADMQCLQLASMLHDVGHRDKIGSMHPDIDNVKHALRLAYNFLSTSKVPLDMKIMILGLILATESSGEIVEPDSFIQHLMVMIDIGNFALGFEKFLDCNLRVLAEYDPKFTGTVNDWYEWAKKFLQNFCRNRIDLFRRFTGDLERGTRNQIINVITAFEGELEKVVNNLDAFYNILQNSEQARDDFFEVARQYGLNFRQE